MSSSVLRLFLVLGMSVPAACSQQAEKKPAGPPANKPGQQASTSQAPVMTMPQPGPEMQKAVNKFSGTWSITEKYEPTARMPEGGVGQGEEVWRPGPGGLSLIEEYNSKTPIGEVLGLGVSWWDAKAQGTRVVWCDNTNPGGCIVNPVAAKPGELIAEYEREGKKFKFKEVFSFTSPNSFTQTLYEGESGGELKPFLIIHATRLTKATPPAGHS